MKIFSKTLANGLTVILAPMKNTGTVAEIFAVRAGWKYEWPEIYGISHFIEHMMFGGAKRHPTSLDINKAVENKGGTLNAFTSEEHTCYLVKILSKFANVAHDIISDMILNSKFDSREIEKERGTILEEFHMSQDSPMVYLMDELWPRLLYGNQPAGQNGLGSPGTIKNLKRKQFLEYVKKLYVGPNSAVCLAGKINPDQAFKDLDKYYGALSSDRPKIEKVLVREKQRTPEILLKTKRIAQTHIALGVRTYNLFHPDRYTLKVLGVILGAGMSSRMFEEVRLKRGLAYDIRNFTTAFTDSGWLATYAGLNPEKANQALGVIMDQYKRIAEEKVSLAELRRAKEFILGYQEMELEDSAELARDLAIQFSQTGEIETPEQRAEHFKKVTRDDVLRVAQDVFRNKNLNLAIVGPIRKDLEEKLYSILKF